MNIRNIFKKTLFFIVLLFLVIFYNEYARYGLPDASGVGRKDDQSIALIFLSIIAFLFSFTHFYSKILIFVVTLVFTCFAILNWWFYDFYRDYITFSIYKLAAYTDETALAWDGLKYKGEALVYLLVTLAILVILFAFKSSKPQKTTLRITALIVLLIGIQQQYVVGTRAIGGLKHKGVNHVSYFIKSFFPQKEFAITEDHVNHLKKALQNDDIAKANVNYPLFQQVEAKKGPAEKKNVILIVLESVRAFETGVHKKEAKTIAPNLKSFFNESLNFTNFYANSNQTVRGEVALLCSALDYINGAPYSIAGASLQTNCLPSILKQNGYETYWLHGYKKSFFNRTEFFPTLGFDYLLDKNAIDPDDKLNKIGWGISDTELFSFSLKFLEEKEVPFFAEILTLSNHYPYLWDWGIPFPEELELSKDLNPETDNVYAGYKQGIYYTDYAVGKFIEAFKKSKLYDNTILIITSDHGIWTFPDGQLADNSVESEFIKNEIYFRLPMALHYKGVEAQEIESPSSQVDVAPTILDLLDIDYSNAFMGTSLYDFVKGDSKPVYYMAAGSYGFRKNNQYCYPVDTENKCDSKYRKCGSYEIAESQMACVNHDSDFLNFNEEVSLKLLNIDQTSEEVMIDLSQQYLKRGFMPEESLIYKGK